jgi:hypothetical protein
MRCGSAPSVTVSLRYDEREVLVADLFAEPDPNLLDLCEEHVARMSAPVGWTVRDLRNPAPALTG